MADDGRDWRVYGVDCWGPRQLERLIGSLLPAWYQDAERYTPGGELPDGTSWPCRATRKPKTGIDLIDSTPTRPSECLTKGKGLRF